MGGTVVCGLKSMKVSKRRRTFDSGKALSIDLRGCLHGGGPALFAEIPPLSYKFFVKFIFVYMRGGPALLGEISLLTTLDLA